MFFHFKKFSLIILLLSPALSVPAQWESIDLDLDGQVILGDIPFDVPFYFKIEIPSEIEKIEGEVKYQDPKTRYYRPYKLESKDSNDYHSIGSFRRLNADQTHAYISCPPLHPNVRYDLKLTLWNKVDFSEQDEIAFREQIRKIITDEVLNYNDLTQAKFEAIALRTDQAFADQFTNGIDSFVDLEGNSISFDLPTEDFLNLILDNIDQEYQEQDHNNTYANHLSLLEEYLVQDTVQKILEFLDQLIKNQDNLSGLGKVMWERKRLIPNNDYDGISLAKMTYQIKELFEQNDFIDLLAGDFKIDPAGETVATETSGIRDHSSLLLLKKALMQLERPEFAYLDNHPVLKRADFYPETIIAPIITFLDQLIYTDRLIVDNRTTYNEIMEKLPVDIGNYYLLSNRYFDLSIAVNVFLEISKNPYFGVDLGIGYTPNLRSFFTNQGINFYLSPVNKKASLKSLRGLDWFTKRFSFYLSISQYLGNNSPSHISSLFDSKDDAKGFRGNFLVGIGWRFSRITRINGGYFITHKNTFDPLDNRKNVVGYPLINFALEFNVAKAYKDLFK